jgi:hypothetical protein
MPKILTVVFTLLSTSAEHAFIGLSRHIGIIRPHSPSYKHGDERRTSSHCKYFVAEEQGGILAIVLYTEAVGYDPGDVSAAHMVLRSLDSWSLWFVHRLLGSNEVTERQQ